MGVKYEHLETDRLVFLTLTGLPTRTDHAVFTRRVAAQVRSGQARGVVIDASAAELPTRQSFSREIWEDFLAEIGECPFAYVPPVGHDNAERQAMIQGLLDEWGACFTTSESAADARAWCLAKLADSSR